MTGRISAHLLTVWLILTVNFALPRAIPGDPLLALQDPTSSQFVSDETARSRLLEYYGLDRPLGEQYVAYLANLGRGELGWSIRYGARVWDVIWGRLPWTLGLVIPALLVSAAISLVAGAEAGWRRGSTLDRVLLVGFAVLRTIPVYVLGIAAILLFSVQLGWLPLGGATTPFRQYTHVGEHAADVLAHWALPFCVLTAELVGARFLLVRNSMLGVLGEEYVRVARAKGLADRTIRYRHALRNTLLPFVTVLSVQIGFAVGGAIFVETLFAYPGMGRLMFEAVGARDYPLLQGAFLIVAALVLLANRAADLAYGILDPRTRSS
ncbi:MAG: ABC transporter permease [Chloroflexota bacterium]